MVKYRDKRLQFQNNKNQTVTVREKTVKEMNRIDGKVEI